MKIWKFWYVTLSGLIDEGYQTNSINSSSAYNDFEMCMSLESHFRMIHISINCIPEMNNLIGILFANLENLIFINAIDVSGFELSSNLVCDKRTFSSGTYPNTTNAFQLIHLNWQFQLLMGKIRLELLDLEFFILSILNQKITYVLCRLFLISVMWQFDKTKWKNFNSK